ncbi:MAG: four helix bundle protein [Verrucomicrobiota bacterium]
MQTNADRSYGNDLSRRTLEFAVRLIALVDALPKSRAADVIGRQLLRSGTSIGANYREAQRAESRDDFIHKHPSSLLRQYRGSNCLGYYRGLIT